MQTGQTNSKGAPREQKHAKGLRRQIMNGYIQIIVICCMLGVLLVGAMIWLHFDFQATVHSTSTRNTINNTIIAHYQWRSQLNTALQQGTEFTGSLDPETCSLGQWMASYTEEDPQAQAILNRVQSPHQQLHNLARELIALSDTNEELANQRFLAEVNPLTDEVVATLQELADYYSAKAEEEEALFETLLLVMLCVTAGLTILIIVGSILLARHTANRIAKPVVLVTNLAQRLALGAENIDETESHFANIYEKNKDNEIGQMMDAFHTMAVNIQANVDVLKRVAAGDMTAFVNIHSSHDAMGKNLYKLVQSNDMMFRNIVQAAHTVATGASEIADASHSLAESASTQADAVSRLSDNAKHTSELIEENNEKVIEAHEVTKKIKSDAGVGNQHMESLMESVERIRDAAERISVVIKTIESIAFETNILALNATIEAANAGALGKGFAVVANKVRELALKSTDAAKESKALIENSIQQTHEGNAIAQEALSTFQIINEEINQIATIVNEIASRSEEQTEEIKHVVDEITQISDAVSSNAAISEQSAASSHEMSQQAEVLRKEMEKFNLRDRRAGHAFIPDEKRNDPDFISAAQRAYRAAEKTGSVGQRAYVDPAGAQMEDAVFSDDLDSKY